MELSAGTWGCLFPAWMEFPRKTKVSSRIFCRASALPCRRCDVKGRENRLRVEQEKTWSTGPHLANHGDAAVDDVGKGKAAQRPARGVQECSIA